MHSALHDIAKASKARALLAVILPVAIPLIMALALGRSGHTIPDYLNLVANSHLSPIRQGVMWLAIAAFVVVYVPPAVTALGARTYLASTPTELVIPSGERVSLANVSAISVRKTFWHKVLDIQSGSQIRQVVVTFARPNASGIRAALQADDNLQSIVVL